MKNLEKVNFKETINFNFNGINYYIARNIREDLILITKEGEDLAYIQVIDNVKFNIVNAFKNSYNDNDIEALYNILNWIKAEEGDF